MTVPNTEKLNLKDDEFLDLVSGIDESKYDLTTLQDQDSSQAKSEDHNDLDWNEARTVDTYIKAFRLTNLQSWADDIGWITLEAPGITVFQARSETGKSVFFKACDCMCFPTRFGLLARKSLIRRGCSTGKVEIKISDDSIISCEFTPTKNYYKKTLPNGQEISYEPTNYLPDALAKDLGWFVNKNTKQLLNLIDDNNGRFFIQGSPKDSAEVLKVITHNKILTQANDNVAGWTKQLIEKSKEIVPALNSVRAQLRVTPLVDADELKAKIDIAEDFVETWKNYNGYNADIIGLEFLVQKKPEEPEDLRDVDELMVILDEIDEFATKLTLVGELVGTRPNVNALSAIDEQNIEDAIEVEEAIENYLINLANLESAVSLKPNVVLGSLDSIEDIEDNIDIFELVEEYLGAVDSLEALGADRNRIPKVVDSNILKDAEELVNVIDMISAFNASAEIMNRLVSLKPKQPKINIEEISQMLDIIDMISEYHETFISMVSVLQERSIARKGIRALDQEIKQLESELKVCPLCGSEFK